MLSNLQKKLFLKCLQAVLGAVEMLKSYNTIYRALLGWKDEHKVVTN